MVDAQLDRVSTPTDDRSPLDYTAMMQDIDQLDGILARVEYAKHIHTTITYWLTPTYDVWLMPSLIKCQQLRMTTALSTTKQ